jgi:cyclohexanone monooxygenase
MAGFPEGDRIIGKSINLAKNRSAGRKQENPEMNEETTTLDFDPEALKRKYQQERDKRLRADANTQWTDTEGRFRHFIDDPYVDPGFSRDPLTDEVEVIIVGGGYSGMMTGVQLRKAGVDNFRIIEKGGDFGGTWYWNRYPGIACDIESYIYLPMLEEVGTFPTRKYAPGEEIFAHCKALAEKFDLYRDVCFQTCVTETGWDAAAGRWTVRTDRGDEMRAKYVVIANMASQERPKLPGIPGIEDFKGHAFHSARWDYDYTGGTAKGDLTKLNDKKVGIIGTGATAVQIIPHLGRDAQHLYVFQRTPSSIDARGDAPTDQEWVKSLEPGWQKKRMENFDVLTSGGRAEVDLINDSWTELARKVNTIFTRLDQSDRQTAADPAKLVQLADFENMERIRNRIESIVENKDWAEALKPWYNQFCKRPCFHDGYLESFNKANVTLVDTAGQGVERVTEKGVVVAGVEYELDCLVFATGFEVGRHFDRRIGYQVIGRDGVTLADKWAKGVRSLHGMFTHGFPNLFMISLAQGAFTFNFLHFLEEVTNHIGYVLGRAQAAGVEQIEVAQQAEDAWVEEILRLAVQREAFMQECTPGYYNYEGDLSKLNAQNGPYGAGSQAFFKTIAAWRDEGNMVGLELTQ